jgi:hypothetical protein
MTALNSDHQHQPAITTARNALATFGVPWVTLARWAAELGVPIGRHGKKRYVVTRRLLEALDARAARPELASGDPVEAVRAALGVRRRGV